MPTEIDVKNLARLYRKTKEAGDEKLIALAESAMNSALNAQAELARLKLAQELLVDGASGA